MFLQRNGCPIGTIFGYVEDGFYDNLAEVMADPDPAVRAKGQKMIGEIKYRNFDDNPAITNADRVIIGDTNPDFVYGITNNFSWKNFTLSFFFQGSQGNDIFNGNLMDVKMGNVANIHKPLTTPVGLLKQPQSPNGRKPYQATNVICLSATGMWKTALT